MKYGCIGHPLGHSYSREIHREIGRYEYELCDLCESELDAFFEKRDFLGINVTIPYKTEVMKYLDSIDADALKIGAVNTVVNRGGKLYGYNTDVHGMRELILTCGVDITGKRAFILGTGGTSRAAMAALTSLGAATVTRVSRTAKDGAIDYAALASAGTEGAVIVNTTPVGMHPAASECVLPRELISKAALVIDAVYNPLATELVLTARECGVPRRGGLYMLASQAVRAAELFLGCELPEEVARNAFRATAMAKANIVLIGMPTSGKSTVGRILASRLGRQLYDTDDMIEKKYSKTPGEIITECGESHFRALEREAVAEAAADGGRVIATGGGAVLDPDNVRKLSRRGCIFYLNTPPGMLVPSAERPLSATARALRDMYSKRHPIYLAASHAAIDTADGADATADRIIADFGDIAAAF